jgi:hypothetical protein
MTNRPAPAAAAPPPPTAEEEKQRFYNDPVSTTRSIVTEALTAAIAPLNEFVKGLRIDGSPFSNMLGKFKADPRFASTLADPQVLAAVERIMEKSELTEINMQSAIVHASGLKTMGLLGTIAPTSNGSPAPSSTPAPAPSPTDRSVTLPAHVRPSSAPVPGPTRTDKVERPPLSENARRIMREQGFKSEEEYWQWMDLPATEVAHTDLGRPKPAGK